MRNSEVDKWGYDVYTRNCVPGPDLYVWQMFSNESFTEKAIVKALLKNKYLGLTGQPSYPERC